MRLAPLSSTETLGASTGPAGQVADDVGQRPALRSGGKFSRLAAGWGWAGALAFESPPSSPEPQPATATSGTEHASSKRSRREEDRVTRGIGAGKASGLIGYHASVSC